MGKWQKKDDAQIVFQNEGRESSQAGAKRTSGQGVRMQILLAKGETTHSEMENRQSHSCVIHAGRANSTAGSRVQPVWVLRLLDSPV